MFPLLSLPAFVASRSQGVICTTCAVLSLLLLLPAPSWAGHWGVVFNGTGTLATSSDTLTCTIKDSVVTGSNPNAPPIAIIGFSGSAHSPGGAGSSIDMGSGSTGDVGSPSFIVTAKLIWQQDFPEDASLPPPTVDVLETGSASCGQFLIGATGLKFFASDGLGDAQVDKATLVYTNAYDYDTSSNGVYLTHLTVPAGQKFVVLPYERALGASLTYASSQGGSSPGTEITYSVQIANPPKSIMINGPVRSTQVYDGSQWRGTGDSVFTTQKILPLPTLNPITVGADYGPLSWTAGLLGSPWPTASDWHYPQSSPIPSQTSAFDRKWAWNSTPQADSGTTFDIHTFQTDRPNVDWPWDSSTKYLPNDFLEFCSNGPAAVQKHIWLQLADTDTYGNHPEWSFANTANYYITFHNEAESPSNIIATTTPLADNSWKLYTGPGSAALSQVGIAPNLDSKGAPIQGTGTYPWSPGSASVYTEYNWGGSYDIPITGIGANGGVNRGQQVSQNVPSQVVQLGQRGMVYWRAPTNRSLFNFRHYSVGGEDITYDANGNVVPHRGFADRPVGGTGTSSADFIVWVKPVNFNFPPTTTLDLAGAK